MNNRNKKLVDETKRAELASMKMLWNTSDNEELKQTVGKVES